MSFANPFLLLGLVGGALPVVIHLIGRRHAPVVDFAAFHFIFAVNRRFAKRERLRQLLLLLVRCLAVLALILAMSRPQPKAAAVVAASSERLIIVIDNSASMAYRRGRLTLFERAREMALQATRRASGVLAVGLVVPPWIDPETGTQKSIGIAPTADLRRVRSAIAAAELAPVGTGLGEAIATAIGFAQGTGTKGSAVVEVFSDLSRDAFSDVVSSKVLPEVRLVDVAERSTSDAVKALPNLAITDVAIAPTGGGTNERRLTVRVRNYGVNGVTDLPIELLIDGVAGQRGYVTVAARSSAEKVFTTRFERVGLVRGELRLGTIGDDGYDADDSYLFALEIGAPVKVLALDGDPRDIPLQDELFFVERALQNTPLGYTPIELRVATAFELRGGLRDELFAWADVVLCANLGDGDDDLAASLLRHLRSGKGVMLSLGDRVDFERANIFFGELLPTGLRDLHQRGGDAAGGPPALSIDRIAAMHPVLSSLGATGAASLRASKTTGYFNLEPFRQHRVVLGFDNGAPALLERVPKEPQDGRLLLLTTSIDLDYSDLALRSAFPALLQNAVRYLARAPIGVSHQSVRAQKLLTMIPPAGASTLALVQGTGEQRRYERQIDPIQEVVIFDGLHEPGIYRSEVKAADGQWSVLRGGEVAVNASLLESDYKAVVAAEVAQTLGGSGVGSGVGSPNLVAVAPLGGEQRSVFSRHGYSTLLLTLFVGFITVECLLAARG